MSLMGHRTMSIRPIFSFQQFAILAAKMEIVLIQILALVNQDLMVTFAKTVMCFIPCFDQSKEKNRLEQLHVFL